MGVAQKGQQIRITRNGVTIVCALSASWSDGQNEDLLSWEIEYSFNEEVWTRI